MSQGQIQQTGTPLPPPGWDNDATGHQRWWDGQQWGPYAPYQPPVQQVHIQHDRYANNMPVSYQRAQQGHSLTAWLILSCLIIGLPGLIYFTVSPNHYWHA